MYNYIEAINYINSGFSIPDGDYYKIKLFANIGDINFILEQYEIALKYYDEALNITLDAKYKESLSKIIAIINKCQTYINLEQYELAIKFLDSLNVLLPYLDDNVKDDIEILTNNIIALSNTYQHNFKEAEIALNKASDLLKEDKVEFSLNKDVFINLTYSKFYKKQKLYDKTLPIYNSILTESINKRLRLEEEIYKEISEIYKKKKSR